jgi:hypothetical protein
MESQSKLYKALHEVQKLKLVAKKGETAKVKTKSGAEYQYSYADLEEIWNILSDPLKDCGLLVIQTPQGDCLQTTVIHVDSGESITSEISLVTSAESQNHMQDLGGAITYARRYALTSMFNIVTNDDDNAGSTTAAATKAARPTFNEKVSDKATHKQKVYLKDLMTGFGITNPEHMVRTIEANGVKKAEQMTQVEAHVLIEKFKAAHFHPVDWAYTKKETE